MIKKILLDIGFDYTGEIPVSQIPFDPSLRQLCEMNRCGAYGKNYACPPHIGEIDKLIEKASGYKNIVVFQKVYRLEDSFDFEGMTSGKNDFTAHVHKIYDRLVGVSEGHLILSAGGCELCETCGAASNTPCRFPERATASLESYGIFVSRLAERCGLKYIHGPNTVSYFGAVLYNDILSENNTAE